MLVLLGLAASGTLTVGLQTNIAYSYSVATGNKNGRTLQKLSTSANVEMRVNGSINNTFYADFQKVRNLHLEKSHTELKKIHISLLEQFLHSSLIITVPSIMLISLRSLRWMEHPSH